MRILVVGSVALDTIRTPYDSGERILGGSAVHFTNAASLLAERIDIVAVVGDDFGNEHLEFLKRKKADLAGLIRAPGKTFHWEGYYEKDMNQAHTVKTELNVFQDFNPVLPEGYPEDEVIFLANIDPVLQLKVLNGMKKPKLVVCDTMNYWIDTKKEDLLKVIKRSDIALLNETEIRLLTGIQNVRLAASELLEKGLKCVIIKRGEYGFLVISNEGSFSGSGMILDNVTDPTGAGDSFAGGLVSYLASHKRFGLDMIKKAVIYANLVASFNVQGLGVAGLDKVTLKDVKNRFIEYKALTGYGKI
jgi:sugar/nucleoside kinase (ribokinase family)